MTYLQKNTKVGLLIFSTFVISISIFLFFQQSNNGTLIDNDYRSLLDDLEKYRMSKIDEVSSEISFLGERFSDAGPFDKDEIMTRLVHAKYRVAIICLSEDNSNRGCRSELHRLEKIDISIPLPAYSDSYSGPKDLYWGFFLNDNDIKVSQSPRQHYAKNGLLARDLSTSGKRKPIHAPDMYNQEVRWNIVASDNMEGTGKSLIFTSSDKKYQIFVGHVHSWNGKTTAMTGDVVGLVGGCSGDYDPHSISTGCHLHIIHKFYDDLKDRYVPFIYDFDPMNWHSKVIPETLGKGVFFTSYNPEVGQNDSSPCEGASGNVCDMVKNGVRVIALSRDMLFPREGIKQADIANGYCVDGDCEFSYGETVELKTIPDTPGHNDPRCNGQFVIVDTMNKRFRRRGDIFFMNRSDNISCTAEIIKVK